MLTTSATAHIQQHSRRRSRTDRPTDRTDPLVVSDTFFFFFNDSLSLLLTYTPRIFTDPLASSLALGQFNYRPILIQFEGRFSTELHRSRTALALIPVRQVVGAMTDDVTFLTTLRDLFPRLFSVHRRYSSLRTTLSFFPCFSFVTHMFLPSFFFSFALSGSPQTNAHLKFYAMTTTKTFD